MPSLVEISSNVSFDAAFASMRRSTREAFLSAAYDICMAVTLFVLVATECLQRFVLPETKANARDMVRWETMTAMNNVMNLIFASR